MEELLYIRYVPGYPNLTFTFKNISFKCKSKINIKNKNIMHLTQYPMYLRKLLMFESFIILDGAVTMKILQSN